MDNETPTHSIHLGSGEQFMTIAPAAERPYNYVTIHRHWDPLFQWWGNSCSRIVTKLDKRSKDGLPIRWYHEKIFDFCYEQYDKYGDYYRLMDGAFATHEQDGIYEVI